MPETTIPLAAPSPPPRGRTLWPVAVAAVALAVSVAGVIFLTRPVREADTLPSPADTRSPAETRPTPAASPKTASPLPVNRKAEVTGVGKWDIGRKSKAPELIAYTFPKPPGRDHAVERLGFGDPAWEDVEFVFDGQITDDGRMLGIEFRRLTRDTHCEMVFRTKEPKLIFKVFENGKSVAEKDDTKSVRLSSNVWYAFRLTLAGNHVKCTVQEGKQPEQTVYDARHNLPRTGQVGFRVYDSPATGKVGYKFRNLRVKAPDGTVLWSGLPDPP